MYASIGQIENKVKNFFEIYTAALLNTIKSKTCVQMAEENNTSHDKLYRCLTSLTSSFDTIRETLTKIANQHIMGTDWWLVVDDSTLSKPFARIIEGLEYYYSSITGTKELSISIVVIGITNGIIFFPLDFEFYISSKLNPTIYLRKMDLAIMLIDRMRLYFNVQGVLLDGLYAKEYVISTLNKKGIRFVIKAHCNWVISFKDGSTTSLKKCKKLRMHRNSRSVHVKAAWHSIVLYFTAELKIDKNGEKIIVYYLSNWMMTSKDITNAYKKRWVIEKFFRTSKQNLGITHCRAHSLEKQRAHIYSVFYAYSFLQIKTLQHNLPCVERAIKIVQDAKPDYIRIQLQRSVQTLKGFA